MLFDLLLLELATLCEVVLRAAVGHKETVVRVLVQVVDAFHHELVVVASAFHHLGIEDM
jgi:hypothetical protein